MHLNSGNTTEEQPQGIPLKSKNIEESRDLAHAIVQQLKKWKIYNLY